MFKNLFEILYRRLTKTLATLGLALLIIGSALLFRPDWRNVGEWHLFTWLQNRQIELTGLASEPDAIDRVTAANPTVLPKNQATLALWLSKKYRVAPEPISALVVKAFETGKLLQLEPTLILAVMAIESGFNPFAQSNMGAQGLMQVMTRVHTEKYENFGGKLAAFDPISNLQVGAKVLFDCIARAGSVEAGLKRYVGSTTEDDGGYSAKVLAEQQRLNDVLKGIVRFDVAQVNLPDNP
jgi:soluble lytic murein transglycosylase-like protein